MPFGSNLLNRQGPKKDNVLRKKNRDADTKSEKKAQAAALDARKVEDPTPSRALAVRIPPVVERHTQRLSSTRSREIIEHYNYLSQPPQRPPYQSSRTDSSGRLKYIPGAWPPESPLPSPQPPIDPNRQQRPTGSESAQKPPRTAPSEATQKPLPRIPSGYYDRRFANPHNPPRPTRIPGEAPRHPSFARAPVSSGRLICFDVPVREAPAQSHPSNISTAPTRPPPQTSQSQTPTPYHPPGNTPSTALTIRPKPQSHATEPLPAHPNPESQHNLYFAYLLLLHHTICTLYIPPSLLHHTSWELSLIEPTRAKIQQYHDIITALTQQAENVKVLSSQAVNELSTKDDADPALVMENYVKLVELRDVLGEAIDRVRAVKNVEPVMRGVQQKKVWEKCAELTQILEFWRGKVGLVAVDMDRRLNV
ncbi:hypothetical protein BJ508DRAFT_320884 [Ascobolus immersus RN42]|uniref:Uncharacterized protein n=1 Tax=Ascobolus immersus RN42 TaxID=1160509 RepID=A0A3N4ILI0_ASCIM|nr:hypothetical protein BJ508DRAFT_320884 [Ascobolus immersus RN42]